MMMRMNLVFKITKKNILYREFNEINRYLIFKKVYSFLKCILGFLAWAIATSLAVGLILLKKWLKQLLQKHSPSTPPSTPPSTQPSTETPTNNPNISQIPLIQHTPDSQATTPSPQCSITVEEPVASRTRTKCSRELKLM